MPPSCHGEGAPRPRLEVADIFRAHGDAYRQSHVLSPEQARAMRAIETCRTATLGGHKDKCVSCAFERPAYNSCRNRHCPKCQSLAQALWVDRRMERILPIPYFHVVFTLPAELRSLVLNNRALLFNLLFQSVAATLLELGADPRWLGALLGFTAVLHTWTRALEFHPHLHCIVTGGGWDADGRWRAVRGGDRFFIRVEVMAELFRGKFLAGLRALYRAGDLRFGGRCANLAQDDVFAAWIDRLYRREWVVYAKRPFAGPPQVLDYVGRYTHRVAISNDRVRDIEHDQVRFTYKDYRVDPSSRPKTMTLAATEFIRRFLLHVLPSGFHRIRYYGFLGPRHRADNLTRCRQLLGSTPSIPPIADPTAEPTRVDPQTRLSSQRCPACRQGHLIVIERLLPWRRLSIIPDSS